MVIGGWAEIQKVLQAGVRISELHSYSLCHKEMFGDQLCILGTADGPQSIMPPRVVLITLTLSLAMSLALVKR